MLQLSLSITEYKMYSKPENIQEEEESFLHGRSNSRLSDGRLSRNSTAKDVEFLSDLLATEDAAADELPLAKVDVKQDTRMLAIIFMSMVVVGLGNRIFNKLMTIPMYNYPNFLNLLTTFVYIPVCFAYIIPMIKKGVITKDQQEIPKRSFAIMGILDGIASIMQIFSATYLPGPLLILLAQAAIPVSMGISKYLLKAKYSYPQYAGALVVAGGIMCVLAPSLSSGGGSIVWAIVVMLSTVPMALSSVYKEIALGEREVDPMYLNGWVAVFQLAISLVLCVPCSLATDPPVPIPDLPENMWDGLRCYFGYNSITCADDDDSCTPDDCAFRAPLFVTIYLVFNQLYNLLIILMLKYGSANLLYMALTLMVPLGNAAFTLPFVPGHQPLQFTDILGLVIIMSGLICYRFGNEIYKNYCISNNSTKTGELRDGSFGDISIKDTETNDALVKSLLNNDYGKDN